MERNMTQRRLLIGFFILAVGAVILMSNLEILDFRIEKYLLRWEMILIGLGMIFLFSGDKKGPGLVLLVLGGAFYLDFLSDKLDFKFHFWDYFWPLLFILAGVLIIFHRKIGHPHCQRKTREDTYTDDDIIDEVSVFGGNEKTVFTQNFKGGKILAVFGGSTFNMLRARMAPGTNVIDVTAVFGGMKLVVPEDWHIKIDVVSIFGGFTDKHRLRPNEKNEKPESELVIKGVVLFGGGEIKSF